MPEKRWSIAPYFIVDDVVATAYFYRDKLGFHFDRFWGEPPGFTILHRGGASIMLRQFPGQMCPNRISRSSDPDDFAWDAYLWVDDADILYSQFQQNGVTIVRSICDQPYNCREFDIEDCNGYRLCFGHTINSEQ